jgi:endo-1,3(4)-beta-glucanase
MLLLLEPRSSYLRSCGSQLTVCSAAAGPFPYESSLDGYGVRFGVSASRQFDGTSIHQYVQSDWRASMVESDGTFANHKATAFDTQSVTVQYFNGTSSMNAYLVPGSPYMTFEYKSATPCLTSLNGGIVTFNGQKLGTGLGSSVLL